MVGEFAVYLLLLFTFCWLFNFDLFAVCCGQFGGLPVVAWLFWRLLFGLVSCCFVCLFMICCLVDCLSFNGCNCLVV